MPPTDWAAHFQARDTAYHAFTTQEGTTTRYYRTNGRYVVRYGCREFYCVNPDTETDTDTDTDNDEVPTSPSSTVWSEDSKNESHSDPSTSNSNEQSTANEESTTKDNITSRTSEDPLPRPTTHTTNHHHDSQDGNLDLLASLSLSAHLSFNASMRARDARNRNRYISEDRLETLKAGRGPVGVIECGDGEVETLTLYDLGRAGVEVGNEGKGIGEGEVEEGLNVKGRRDSGVAKSRECVSE